MVELLAVAEFVELAERLKMFAEFEPVVLTEQVEDLKFAVELPSELVLLSAGFRAHFRKLPHSDFHPQYFQELPQCRGQLLQFRVGYVLLQFFYVLRPFSSLLLPLKLKHFRV